MVIADVAIETFAMESAVLRAEKMWVAASDAKKGNLEALNKICACNTYLRLLPAMVKGGALLTEKLGDLSNQHLVEYEAAGLLKHKLHFAESVITEEKYLFYTSHSPAPLAKPFIDDLCQRLWEVFSAEMDAAVK
jgi:hypothetical protein